MIPKVLSKPTRILIVAGLLVPVLLIGLPAVIAYRAEKEVKSSFLWVTHTLEVERAIASVVNSICSTVVRNSEKKLFYDLRFVLSGCH